MDYLNPGSFNPNMDFRTNPLSGALAGMNIADMQQILDRGYRDSDLGYLSNLNKYQNEMADNPVKQSQRDLDLASHGLDLEMYNSGRKRDEAIAKSDTALSEAKTKQSDNALKQAYNQADFITTAADTIKNIPNFNPAMDANHRSVWTDIVNKGKELGLQMPVAPTTQDIQELMPAMQAKAQAFIMNPQVQAKMAEQKVIADAAQRRTETEQYGQTYRDVYNQESTLTRERENNAARFAQQQARIASTYEGGITAMFQADMNKNGGKVTPDTVGTARMYASVQVDKRLAQDVNYMILQSQDRTGEAAAAYRDRKIEEAASQIPGYSESVAMTKMKEAGGDNSKPSTNYKGMVDAAVKANPKATRQQIIDAAKKAGKLPSNYSE